MKFKEHRAFPATALICLAIFLGFFLAYELCKTHWREKREMAQLQRQYPFESVAPRLEYETSRAVLASEVKLSPRSAQFLQENDERPRSIRAESLYRLHSETAEKFINTFGNGMSRTPLPGPRYLESETAEPVEFAQPTVISAAGESSKLLSLSKDDVAEGLNAWRAPSEHFLATYHNSNQGGFASDSNTGYARDREHVAGFAPIRCRTWRSLTDILGKYTYRGTGGTSPTQPLRTFATTSGP